MNEKVKFGKITKEETPHRICPVPEEVFFDKIDENAEWFLPLLSVDASKINPEWQGNLHFVYNEANQEGGVTFKLNDNKYVYEGSYDFDDGGMNEREKNEGFVELVEVEVPQLTEDNKWDWTDDVTKAGKALGHSVLYCNQFGSAPWWAQSDETPLDPDGEKMTFVGQIRADDYSDEVADKDLYLFYSPKHQLVVQIDQCT